MNKISHLLLFTFLFSLFISSCSHDDDAPYPSIISEMADLYTNESGTLTKFVLDNNKEYRISNPQSGYHAKALYRVLCGYVPTDNSARVFQLTSAYILRDSVERRKQDPTSVLSVWRTERYINMHLASKTFGGRQHWGFITDSIVSHTDAEGKTSSHAYLSLHHNQNNDPTSYTEDVYASLPLDSIKGVDKQAPITLSIQTFDGKKTFEL